MNNAGPTNPPQPPITHPFCRAFGTASSRALMSVAAALAISFGSFGCSDEENKTLHLQRANTFYADGRYERAEIEYLNVLQIAPNDARAISRLGSIYFEKGRHGRALGYLLRARELAPGALECRRQLAQLFLAGGSYEAALDEATYILDQRPDDPEAPVLMAEAALLPAAIASVGKRLDALPQNSPAVLVARGVLLVREGDADNAQSLFELALSIQPDLAIGYAGMGSVYESRSELTKARAAYARAAELSPPTSPHRLRYARFLLQSDHAAEAQRVLTGILDRAPGFVPALLRQVESAARTGQFAQAEAFLKAALAQDPNHPEAMILTARLALATKQPEKALTAVGKFLEMYPDSPDGYLEAARAHLFRNDLNSAAADLRRALDLVPDSPEAIILLASVNIRQGNRAQAIFALRTLLAKRPLIMQAHALLAEAYRGEGDWKEALAIYHRIEQVTPDSERAPYLQGLVLLQQKRLAEAREAFERAYQRNPKSLPTLDRLTSLDIAERKLDAAIGRLKSAQAVLPEDPGLDVLMAKIHLASGRGDLAEASLRHAVKIQPEYPIAYGMLAAWYASSGDIRRALDSLASVVQQNPRDVGAWMLSGILHQQRGEFKEARDVFEKALAVNPRFSPALNSLAYLYSESLNEGEKAFDLAKRARDIAPNDPYIADTLGWILHRRGEYVWAQSLLRESVEKLPGSAEVQYHLALTQYNLGDEPAARISFETALALSPAFSGAEDCRRRLRILEIDPETAPVGSQDELRAYVTANPKDAIALGRLASLQQRRGDFAQALVYQQRAVEANPLNVASALALIRMYSAANETNKALELARRTRKSAPDDSDVALMLGRLSLEARDFRLALSLLQEASGRKPRDASVFRDLSRAAYSLGRVAQCRVALFRSMELLPNPRDAAMVQEQVQLIDAMTAAAIDPVLAERAELRVRENPKDVPALMVLAATARERADVSAERDLLERALAVYPNFSPAQRQLALVLAADPKEDKRTLQIGMQAREEYQDDPALAVALAKVSYRQGDHRQTVALLEPVAPRLAADAFAWFYLGMSQSHLHRSEAARESLTRALLLGLSGHPASEAQQLLTKVN